MNKGRVILGESTWGAKLPSVKFLFFIIRLEPL
jgi:hypothetical protein